MSEERGGVSAVIVAENGERTLYGLLFTEIVGRAVRPEKPRFPSKTRGGRARVAAAASQSTAER